MPVKKYNIGLCAAAKEFLSQPTAPTQFALAHELGISYMTHCNWKREHKEYKEAVKQGLVVRKETIEGDGGIPHYTPGVCKKVVQLMAAGKSRVGAAAAMGISIELLGKWRDAYPELQEALNYGRTLEQAYWEQIGQEAMQGKVKDFNNAVWRTSVKHRFGYTEQTIIKGDKENPLQIEDNSAANKLLEVLLQETIEPMTGTCQVLDTEAIEQDKDISGAGSNE